MSIKRLSDVATHDFEHAGLRVLIVSDEDGAAADPQQNDNAGTLYSWAPGFKGDEPISEPDLQVDVEPDWDADPVWETIDLAEYMRRNYDAALTIPLWFEEDRGGAHIYPSDEPNCALCFTQAEIDEEWAGHLDPYPVQRTNADGSPGEVVEYGGARSYAKARINELDEWLRGMVYGVVVAGAEGSPQEDTIYGSVWGFIGDPFGKSGEYMLDEGRSLAESCAEEIAAEAAEVHYWACRDVVTVG